MLHTLFARLGFMSRHRSGQILDMLAKLHQIDPNIQFKVPRSLPRRLVETALYRLRLEVAFTNRCLYLNGFAASLCTSCHVLDTIEHVLCHFVKYEDEQKGFKDSLGISILVRDSRIPPWTLVVTRGA